MTPTSSGSNVATLVLPVATAVVAIAIFIADTVTDVDIAYAVLYVMVVLMAARSLSARGVVLVAAGCLGLTVVSYLLTASTGRPFEGIVNTLISLGAILLTAVLAVQAQKATEALQKQASLWVEAEATTGLKTVEVDLRQALVAPSELPLSILQYVIRTQDPVISEDASREKLFPADEYVASRHVRSVLCLPLIKQAKLVGVLYIENNVAASVFTPARIAVLKLLAWQAAISLENAHLYGELTMSEERR
jgi:hypothetical protein